MFFLILIGRRNAEADADLGPLTKMGKTTHGLYYDIFYSYFFGGIIRFCFWF
jgi:hypothetical protein